MKNSDPGVRRIRQNLTVDLQWACTGNDNYPTETDFCRWAESAVISPDQAESEVCIRVVDGAEMQQSNSRWRGQEKTTNVLSFPADFPAEAGLEYFGDILICAEVVMQESKQQQKAPDAHWAHMVVHGMLHLQGYDHIDDQQATEMELIEINILTKLGYPNPYTTVSGSHPIISNITEVEQI